jgi:hypothetical protein
MKAMIRKTLLLSFCCHLGFFSLFNFTFGSKLPKAEFAGVSFLGALLSSPDFEGSHIANRAEPQVLKWSLKTLPLRKVTRQTEAVSSVYIKPQSILAHSSGKSVYPVKPSMMPPSLKQFPSVVMLYPRLPQHFLLYFKDRQSVHIELMFNLVSRGRAKAIITNRKISSGNLEVDLLSKRYLGHYLFVQQAAFPLGDWQTVKIDLSAKEDIGE